MLHKFLYRRITLTSELVASFGKSKLPAREDEPFYYTPLPQTIPRQPINNYDKKSEEKVNRFSLHPHAFWLTQGKGTERPFTGRYWDTKDLGHYGCIVCTKKLFLSDHKFFPPTGIASFWTSITGAVKLEDDVESVKTDNENLTSKLYDNDQKEKRVVCGRCNSHLGTLHHDGPPPTFKRYSINSGALDFFEKPWFHPPQYYKQMRKKLKEKRFRENESRRLKNVEKRPKPYEVDPEALAEIEENASIDKGFKYRENK